MLQKIWVLKLLIIAGLLFNIPAAEASIILNEIFADPASGLTGDANNDGVRSGSDDEFAELLNLSADQVDVTGWSVADGVSTRHIFPSNSIIGPYAFLVVFGGGDPDLPGVNWQTASSGALGLNNGGDSVFLYDADAVLIDQAVYGGIGGHDESITLFPDGSDGEYLLHSGLDQAQGALFSPGTSIDSRLSLVVPEEDEAPIGNPVVPELPSAVYFLTGWVPFLLRRS